MNDTLVFLSINNTSNNTQNKMIPQKV